MPKIGTAYVDVVGNFKPLEAQMAAASRSGSGFGKRLATIGKVAGGALLGIGAAATKMAFDFEDSMEKVHNLVGVNRKQTDEWGDALLKMAPKVGKAPQELADALYFVSSSGIRANKVLETTKIAAEASALGLGETETVADALTSAMNAYADAGLSARDATNVLIQTVKFGKLEADELAGAIGRVVPVAANLKVPFEDVGATLGVMSLSGLNAAEAVTALRGILNTFIKPTAEAKEALEGVGLSAEDIRSRMGEKGGLLEVLRLLDDRFHGNVEAMGQVFGNVRALTGVFNVLGTDQKNVNRIFAETNAKTDDLGKSWKEFNRTPAQQMRRAVAGIQAAMVKLGEQILPEVADAFEDFSKIITSDRLTGEEKVSGVIDLIADRVSDAIPVLTDLGVKAGAALIRGIGQAFTEMNLLQQLLTGAALIRLIGGPGVLTSAGKRLGAFLGVGVAEGVAAGAAGGAAVGGAAGGAARGGIMGALEAAAVGGVSGASFKRLGGRIATGVRGALSKIKWGRIGGIGLGVAVFEGVLQDFEVEAERSSSEWQEALKGLATPTTMDTIGGFFMEALGDTHIQDALNRAHDINDEITGVFEQVQRAPGQKINLAEKLHLLELARRAGLAGDALDDLRADLDQITEKRIVLPVNAIEKLQGQLKKPFNLSSINDMIAILDKLPRSAQDNVATMLLGMTKTLERDGKLPKGATEDLLGWIQARFPKFRKVSVDEVGRLVRESGLRMRDLPAIFHGHMERTANAVGQGVRTAEQELGHFPPTAKKAGEKGGEDFRKGWRDGIKGGVRDAEHELGQLASVTDDKTGDAARSGKRHADEFADGVRGGYRKAGRAADEEGGKLERSTDQHLGDAEKKGTRHGRTLQRNWEGSTGKLARETDDDTGKAERSTDRNLGDAEAKGSKHGRDLKTDFVGSINSMTGSTYRGMRNIGTNVGKAGKALGLKEKINFGLEAPSSKEVEALHRTQAGGIVRPALALGGLAGIVPGFSTGDRHLLSIDGVPTARVESKEGIFVGNRRLMDRLAVENALTPRFQRGGSVTGDVQGLVAPFMTALRALSAATTAISVTSGFRTRAEQAALFAANPNPNEVAPPGTSHHEQGIAADISPEKPAYGGAEGRFGLGFPMSWEPWHIELLNAGAAATAAVDLIKRIVMTGPAGPLLDIGQAALDQTRRWANKWIEEHAGTGTGTAAGISVGPGALSRVEIRRLLEATGMPDIMGWVAYAESGFDPSLTNPSSGAAGLWQFLPSTWAGLGVSGSPYNPTDAATGAAKLYAQAGLSPWEASRNAGQGGGWGQHMGEAFQRGGLLLAALQGGGGLARTVPGLGYEGPHGGGGGGHGDGGGHHGPGRGGGELIELGELVRKINRAGGPGERRAAIRSAIDNFRTRSTFDFLGADGELGGRLKELRDAADEAATNADLASQLAETDDDGNLIPGTNVFGTKDELTWVNEELGHLWNLRNELILDDEKIAGMLRRIGDVIDRLTKGPKGIINAVNGAIREGKKRIGELEDRRDDLAKIKELLTGDATESSIHKLEDRLRAELHKPERDQDKRLVEILRRSISVRKADRRLADELDKPKKQQDQKLIDGLRRAVRGDDSGEWISGVIEGNRKHLQRANEKQTKRITLRDALRDKVLPAVTGRKDDLTAGEVTLLDELGTVQGRGVSMDVQKDLPALGVFGGELFAAQLRQRDLLHPDQETPETSSDVDPFLEERLRLTQEQLLATQQRLLVHELQDPVLLDLRQARRFHEGGIVGGVGEQTIVARSGEGVFTEEQMTALGAGATIIIEDDAVREDRIKRIAADGTRQSISVARRSIGGRR